MMEESANPPTSAVAGIAWGTCVIKAYFDRKGHCERAVKQLSSGNAERDQACIAYAKAMVIEIPRLHTVRSGPVWRVLRFKPDFSLGPAPNVAATQT